MDFSGYAFYNTGLPLLLVGVAALILPRFLISNETRLHSEVFLGVLKTAALLVLIGFLVTLWFDDRRFSAAIMVSGEAALWLIYWWTFLSSLALSIVWLPILAIAWLGKSQNVEKLKSDDQIREGL